MYEVDPNLSHEQLEEAGFVITDEQEELSSPVDIPEIEPTAEEIAEVQELANELEQEDIDEEEIQETKSRDDPKPKKEKKDPGMHITRSLSNGGRGVMHNTATVYEGAYVVPTCPIGRYSIVGADSLVEARYIGREVRIGKRSNLGPGVEIGIQGKAENWEKPQVTIGSDVVFKQGVKVYPNTEIGDRTHIGEGSVIGCKPKKQSEKRTGNQASEKPTVIGADCYVGDKVKVEMGANIPDGYQIVNETRIPTDFSLGTPEETGFNVIDNNEITRQLAMQVAKKK